MGRMLILPVIMMLLVITRSGDQTQGANSQLTMLDNVSYVTYYIFELLHGENVNLKKDFQIIFYNLKMLEIDGKMLSKSFTIIGIYWKVVKKNLLSNFQLTEKQFPPDFPIFSNF